jgi:RND family efflux transporter MFP subunit
MVRATIDFCEPVLIIDASKFASNLCLSVCPQALMRRPPTPHRSRYAVATLCVVAIASVVACKRPDVSQPQVNPTAESSAPVRTAVAVATARDLPEVLAATGSLLADVQSEVTPLVAGRVMQVLVERGAHVRENDPLIRLRDVDFRTTSAQAQATLGQARARLGIETGRAFNAEETAEVRAAAANRDLAVDAQRRAERLFGQGAMSDAELLRARTQAQAAQEQYRSAVNGVRGAYYAYQQAQSVASQAGRALADSIVRAPFAGEVAERRINVGEYVTPQRSVVLLVKTDPLRMEIQVPQERLSQIRRDQAVEVRVDAYPDRVFTGTVRYISAAVRAETRSLVAEAVIPNGDGALRPGLFATVRVALGQNRPVVAIPTRAVLSEAGTNRVFVVQNGRVQERVVTIADRTRDEVLIERGVAAGERVATETLMRLGDGVMVSEQATANP